MPNPAAKKGMKIWMAVALADSSKCISFVSASSMVVRRIIWRPFNRFMFRECLRKGSGTSECRLESKTKLFSSSFMEVINQPALRITPSEIEHLNFDKQEIYSCSISLDESVAPSSLPPRNSGANGNLYTGLNRSFTFLRLEQRSYTAFRDQSRRQSSTSQSMESGLSILLTFTHAALCLIVVVIFPYEWSSLWRVVDSARLMSRKPSDRISGKRRAKMYLGQGPGLGSIDLS